MKKYKIILTLLLILVFTSIPVFAKNNIVVYIDGNNTEVREVPVLMNGKPVYSDIPTYIHKGSTMVPIRFVAEHYGAKVDWDNKTKSAIVVHNGNNIVMTINQSTVEVNNKLRTIDNNASPKLVNTGGKSSNTMVPLRFISEVLGYEVGYDEEKGIPFINSEEMEPEVTEGITDISMIGNSKIKVISSKAMEIDHSRNGNIINININNISLENKELLNKRISGDQISDLRVSEDGNNLSINVILDGEYDYNISKSSDGKEFTISPMTKLQDIKKETIEGKESVVIYTGIATKVNRSSLSNPKRFIFDIMDSSLGTDYKEYNISFEGIKNVRASQFSPEGIYNANDKVVRVVLDMEDNANINVKENNGNIVITPTIDNTINNNQNNTNNNSDNQDKGKEQETNGLSKILKYSLNGRISNLDIELKKNTSYSFNYNENQKTVEIQIPKKNLDIQAGDFKIQDGMIDSIKVTDSSDSIKITVNLFRKLNVTDLNNGNGESVKIQMEREAIGKPSDRIIVIDAGHGGLDPGAVSNGIKEKDINLPVSKKVDSLLKQKGYKTLMTREDDSYISLGGRANLANGEAADLFISIHANSVPNSSTVNGIEVLYSGNQNSKALAGFIQEELIKSTNAADRGTKHRPNLVVLRDTKMTDSLVELGFLTNSEEAAKLDTESYQNILAEAIVKGIEKYFTIYD